jgi:hypothetical protein
MKIKLMWERTVAEWLKKIAEFIKSATTKHIIKP